MDMNNMIKLIESQNINRALYYKCYTDKICLKIYSEFPKDIINEIYVFMMYNCIKETNNKNIKNQDIEKTIKCIINNEKEFEEFEKSNKLNTNIEYLEFIYNCLDNCIWDMDYLVNNTDYCIKIEHDKNLFLSIKNMDIDKKKIKYNNHILKILHKVNKPIKVLSIKK